MDENGNQLVDGQGNDLVTGELDPSTYCLAVVSGVAAATAAVAAFAAAGVATVAAFSDLFVDVPIITDSGSVAAAGGAGEVELTGVRGLVTLVGPTMGS